jgi:hypothetical protein
MGTGHHGGGRILRSRSRRLGRSCRREDGPGAPMPSIRCPPSDVLHQVPSIRCPPSGALHQMSSIRCPPSDVLHQVSSIRCPPSGALQHMCLLQRKTRRWSPANTVRAMAERTAGGCAETRDRSGPGRLLKECSGGSGGYQGGSGGSEDGMGTDWRGLARAGRPEVLCTFPQFWKGGPGCRGTAVSGTEPHGLMERSCDGIPDS